MENKIWGANKFTTTKINQAMFKINHVNDMNEPIYDSYNQWQYFAADEVECERVLAHLWDEFGSRGNVSVTAMYAGPTFYQEKLNPDMCSNFKDCRTAQNFIENIKSTYWDGDISMSELLLAPEYAVLSDADIEDLLSWAGEDEYINAADIREGQELVNEKEAEYERD